MTKRNKKIKSDENKIEIANKEEIFGTIDPVRLKLREKARRERKRKSTLRIAKNKIVSPFKRLYRKMETYRFIFSRDSRRFQRVAKRKEKRVSDKAAQLVFKLDKKSEDKVSQVGKLISKNKRILETLTVRDVAKKRPIIGYVVMMLIISTGIIFTFNYVTAFEYSYKGKEMGIVAEQQDVTEVISVVNSQLTKEHDTAVVIDENNDIEFKRVITIGEKTQDSEEVFTTLTYMQDITITAYGIFVDGKRAGVVSTEAAAETILSEILAEYSKPAAGVTYESISFVEDVEVMETEVKLGTVSDADVVKDELMTGLDEVKGYIVEAGDTLASIAEDYDLMEEELQEANPDANKEGLALGETLTVIEKKPLVNVEVIAEVDYTKIIEHETIKEDDDSIYEGEESVTQEGEDGEEEVISKIVYLNGEISSEEILESKIVKEAVTEKVLVGTKERPASVGDGNYINPFSDGVLSSVYGTRWGRMHSGVDIAGNTGSTLVAADGGIVTFSGYNGAYGYMIMIDHQNGQETLYAHCSVLSASVGDEVYQGQKIAEVGSTGSSTGPHVHFEIHIDGTTVDPGPYIGLY